MFRSRHLHAAEILRHFPDACVVRGHDDFAQLLRSLALLDDVLDERLARDERERLAGKPRRSKPRGNDANDFHALHLATDETRMKHRIFKNSKSRSDDGKTWSARTRPRFGSTRHVASLK